MYINTNVSGSTERYISIYYLDWDSTVRTMTVDAMNAQTSAVLDTRTVNNFNGGLWFTYRVKGNIKFRITKTGGVNAVFSGVFFDTAFTTPTPSPTPVPFSDNFDDGNANGWTTYGGTWTVTGGQYCVNSDPGGKSIANNTNFSNFTYEADVMVGSSGNAGLIFRVSNPSVGIDAYNGYYAGINAGNDTVELGKANGSWTQLGITSMVINADTMYHFKVVANGGNIKVYVSDMTTPKIDRNDSTFTSGGIGARTCYANSKFDNISVH